MPYCLARRTTRVSACALPIENASAIAAAPIDTFQIPRYFPFTIFPPQFVFPGLCRGELQYFSGFCGARRMPPVFSAKIRDAFHELGVALRETVLVELDVVFESGADMAAELEA